VEGRPRSELVCEFGRSFSAIAVSGDPGLEDRYKNRSARRRLRNINAARVPIISPAASPPKPVPTATDGFIVFWLEIC